MPFVSRFRFCYCCKRASSLNFDHVQFSNYKNHLDDGCPFHFHAAGSLLYTPICRAGPQKRKETTVSVCRLSRGAELIHFSFATYTNGSTIVLPTFEAVQVPTSSLYQPAPIPIDQSVGADTALVVEPIQQTVFTHVIPAITFLNPEGKPLATEDARLQQ